MMLDIGLAWSKIALLLSSSVIVTSRQSLCGRGFARSGHSFPGPLPGQPADHSAGIGHAQPCLLTTPSQSTGAAPFLSGRSVSPASLEVFTGNRREQVN